MQRRFIGGSAESGSCPVTPRRLRLTDRGDGGVIGTHGTGQFFSFFLFFPALPFLSIRQYSLLMRLLLRYLIQFLFGFVCSTFQFIVESLLFALPPTGALVLRGNRLLLPQREEKGAQEESGRSNILCGSTHTHDC